MTIQKTLPLLRSTSRELVPVRDPAENHYSRGDRWCAAILLGTVAMCAAPYFYAKASTPVTQVEDTANITQQYDISGRYIMGNSTDPSDS